MSKERTTLEVLAPTVEEAIEKGLEQLGLDRDDVDVEVLDEGKRNLFRFASKQARVKLTVLESILKPERLNEPEDTNEVSEKGDDLNFGEMFEAELDASQNAPIDLDNTDIESIVQETVAELLRKMEVQAGVSVRKVYQEDENRETIYVNIEGSDMSFLIGRRAETLNALQYITSLIINKKLNQWVPLQLDVFTWRYKFKFSELVFQS